MLLTKERESNRMESKNHSTEKQVTSMNTDGTKYNLVHGTPNLLDFLGKLRKVIFEKKVSNARVARLQEKISRLKPNYLQQNEE